MSSPSSPPSDAFHYYGFPDAVPQVPEKPVRVVFLTSLRDVGTCDKNGQVVSLPEGRRYMEGTIERTIEETREGGALHGLIEVVAIITDDLERDMRDSEYPDRPSPEHPWIHPLHLRDPEGRLVAQDMTYSIPSDFRALPRGATEERAAAKLRFEERVLDLMQELDADVLISDHYMARIEHMIDDERGMMGRVLNIHPAVTVAGHPDCLRGPTPTQDAIDRVRGGVRTSTGATLHFVNAVIDDGAPIAYAADTPVYPHDQPQHLRYRNYQQGKLPLFIAGLRHYILNIYPYLDERALDELLPLIDVPA